MQAALETTATAASSGKVLFCRERSNPKNFISTSLPTPSISAIINRFSTPLCLAQITIFRMLLAATRLKLV